MDAGKVDTLLASFRFLNSSYVMEGCLVSRFDVTAELEQEAEGD
jgi:hypothetical protein